VCEEAKVSHHKNIINNNNLPIKMFCPSMSEASEIECDICCLSHATEQMTRVLQQLLGTVHHHQDRG